MINPRASIHKTAKSPLRSRRRRRGLETVGGVPRVLLVMLVFHGLVAQDAESKVGDGEAAEDHEGGEEHCLVGDGLDEGVEDFREGVGGDFGAGDFHRILGHHAFPVVALGFQGGRARAEGAAVDSVVFCCVDDGGDDVCAGFEGFLVNVALDGGPEAVDHVGACG